MLTKEAIMEIKILSRQGMSIRAISRKLGGGGHGIPRANTCGERL